MSGSFFDLSSLETKIDPDKLCSLVIRPESLKVPLSVFDWADVAGLVAPNAAELRVRLSHGGLKLIQYMIRN